MTLNSPVTKSMSIKMEVPVIAERNENGPRRARSLFSRAR